MKIIAWRISLALAAIFFGLAIVAVIPFRDQIRKMRTHDVFGKIIVTLDKRLNSTNWLEFQLAQEVQSSFPEIKVSSFGILDAWGNAIRVELSTNAEVFNVIMVSSGKDHHFKTSDDITRAISIRMDE